MDDLTKEQRHKNMSSIRSSNTKIEIVLRKALWAKGHRYRKNCSALPGKPDIVFSKQKVAIFCDSEFFHGRDWDVLRPRLLNSNNSEYWLTKIQRNMERDREDDRQLFSMGWTVIRLWGKDILNRTDECIAIIEEAITPDNQVPT